MANNWSVSKRYDQRSFVYWWDVWDERRGAVAEAGELVLAQRDTKLVAHVPAADLLPLLIEERRTSRGRNKGGKGNWAIYVRPHRMDEVEVAGPRPATLAVTWRRPPAERPDDT